MARVVPMVPLMALPTALVVPMDRRMVLPTARLTARRAMVLPATDLVAEDAGASLSIQLRSLPSSTSTRQLQGF